MLLSYSFDVAFAQRFLLSCDVHFPDPHAFYIDMSGCVVGSRWGACFQAPTGCMIGVCFHDDPLL